MFSTKPGVNLLRVATPIFFLGFLSALLPAFGGLNSIAGSKGVSASTAHEAVAEKFVEEKLRLWQDRMQLQGWKIHVHLVRSDLLEPRTLGNVHWDTDRKEATIGVLSTYDYPLPFEAMLPDMEVTVVHELVHIELASLPHSDASSSEEEHAVVALTRVILSMSK
jgi:hypothetical protein